MSNPEMYDQDLQIQESWMQNIDPLLRQAQNQSINSSWQQQQQRPLQKWMTEPERALFTAGPLPNRPLEFPRLMRQNEGVSSLPQATRMVSPAPSQEFSSQCSSARSPAAELEYYHDTYYPSQDDFSFPNTTSHFSQGLPDAWQEPQQSNMFPQLAGFSCVSLNQVQGFEDPQDISYEADEGYNDLDLKHDYSSIEVDHQIKPQSHSYRHSPSDEGLGASIKDEGSPHDSTCIHVDDSITDADAEAEIDEEIVAEEEPDSDTEYAPKSSRNRKRRASKASSPPSTKRRMTKSPKTKSSHTCKSCNHAPFKDAASLQRHVNQSHTRAFICVFAFAGCRSTFASKNEWKRHVSSQHLNLSSWVCELGDCGKVVKKNERGNATKGSEFNRKDLFTQHLRRMHSPFDVKRKNKKIPEWEDRLKELQVSCLRVKRLPPSKLQCPMDNCDAGVFEGNSCWDERMEHVGKHLEKAALSSGAGKFEVRQEDDELLVNWAVKEHIVDRTANGGFKLAGQWYETDDDEDAEGEDE